MSESEGEQTARSLALEQAYVHEVYEQCADRTLQSRQWPKIYQFLEELEPGALVCDIGCGNGKYLNVNHNVFKIGADRCERFTNIARDKKNEVLTCDNLSLPFRDESFDAVLSIAVVHHFSTTERRVRAIKELARVLRIGGRLIISVWAMEQKHRKFESQDVLVPWPKAYGISSTGSPLKLQGLSFDERNRGKSAHTFIMSKRSCKNKGYWIDPIFSPSPSTSSLSSPNETCYSFFRRALQKLAGGRRNSRAWFLENWQNSKFRHSYDEDDVLNDDDACVDDLPIELRRLEEHSSLALDKKLNAINNKRGQLRTQNSDSLSVKSKSLSNIVDAQRLDLVRSRSSIPTLCNSDSMEQRDAINPVEQLLQKQESGTDVGQVSSIKPKLVKQKNYLLEDNEDEDDAQPTAINDLSFKDAFGLEISKSKQRNVHKQSSMNEELMSKRENIRKNIMKQASLNEEFLYKSKPTLEAFKDSFYSGSANKRFQLLKSGLTNRIKQSTNNIEKVSGMSIKNGFVRMLQSWKSTDNPSNSTQQQQKYQNRTTTTTSCSPTTSRCSSSSTSSGCSSSKRDDQIYCIERRLSREDGGSDSSKDSSLLSDTSVDSEDSLPSVIYNPRTSCKTSPQQTFDTFTSSSGLPRATTSAPPSPHVKYVSELTANNVSTNVLLKHQFPATSKSLPPPSPPGLLSPHTLKMANKRPFFSGNDVPILNKVDEVQRSFESQQSPLLLLLLPTGTKSTSKIKENDEDSILLSTATSNDDIVNEATNENDQDTNNNDTSSLITNAIDEALERLNEEPLIVATSITTAKTKNQSLDANTNEDNEKSHLNQIKDLSSKKSGFATRTKTTAFPIVRRASSTSGRFETVTKVLPRLSSLELFNPETDDLDSDSSGVSSPESIGSVISVITDERYVSKKIQRSNVKTEKNDEKTDDGAQDNKRSKSVVETIISPVESTWNEECKRQLNDLTDRLSGDLINDIDQYCRKTKLDLDDKDPNNLAYPRRKISNYESGHKFGHKNNDNDDNKIEDDGVVVDSDNVQRSCSEEDSDASNGSIFVLNEKNEEYLIINDDTEKRDKAPKIGSQRCNDNSIESSDIGDSIENTISERSSSSSNGTDNQQATTTTRRLCSSSNASLASSSKFSAQPRSASEETVPSSSSSGSSKRSSNASSTAFLLQRHLTATGNPGTTHNRRHQLLQQQQQQQHQRRSATSNGTLSGSSSQESLSTDQMTYHQYYHVFREGELDQLIEKYVENLHVISSYYDQSSWCIVAEKVQVWTI